MMNPLLTQHSAQWVEQWLKILSDLGRASSTISAYRQALNHYLTHCDINNIQPELVTFEHISAYLRPQLPGMEHPVASATLQLRITAIRLWYDFLLYHNICETNPVPRATSSSPIFVGRGLIPRLIKLPVIPNDTEWFHFLKLTATAPLRDRLMLALAYYGALRRAEVTSLRIEDMDLAHRLIRIRAEITKNHRERVVCYHQEIASLLMRHLKELKRVDCTGGALFRSVSDRNNGQPLSYWSWSKIVRAWAIQANLPDLSTHTFRHLRLTHLARAGWKLHELATYAGHRDLKTTQLYLHLSGTELAAKMSGAIAAMDLKVAQIFLNGDES
ncbi:tyrosine-type recombinase/integrase [Xenorhabdus budapestensis]|uniref:Integrase/recombinase n=1 Tax=Xenorhabdus budapestensis TaxID=290110 RepID=A0A2D0J034_XENBU|nr:site-specific integrase [Xenorhabdus budapestensis]PHM27614.1 integrase/recombinase [Xenorhabdus budapestensis]